MVRYQDDIYISLIATWSQSYARQWLIWQREFKSGKVKNLLSPIRVENKYYEILGVLGLLYEH